MASTTPKKRTGSRLTEAASVPDLRSGEAAEWYDTHDTARLPTELVEGGDGEARPGLETVAIRLSRREVDELKRRAGNLGIGYTTYVRMLVNRHVLQEPPIQ